MCEFAVDEACGSVYYAVAVHLRGILAQPEEHIIGLASGEQQSNVVNSLFGVVPASSLPRLVMSVQNHIGITLKECTEEVLFLS